MIYNTLTVGKCLQSNAICGVFGQTNAVCSIFLLHLRASITTHS